MLHLISWLNIKLCKAKTIFNFYWNHFILDWPGLRDPSAVSTAYITQRIRVLWRWETFILSCPFLSLLAFLVNNLWWRNKRSLISRFISWHNFISHELKTLIIRKKGCQSLFLSLFFSYFASGCWLLNFPF